MPEHEARVRAFYDHEAEESGAGRRRRPVADWGVGEDVFDRLPSRRFNRAEAPDAPRAARPGRRAGAAPPRPAEEPAIEAPSTPSTDRPQGHPAEHDVGEVEP